MFAPFFAHASAAPPAGISGHALGRTFTYEQQCGELVVAVGETQQRSAAGAILRDEPRAFARIGAEALVSVTSRT